MQDWFLISSEHYIHTLLWAIRRVLGHSHLSDCSWYPVLIFSIEKMDATIPRNCNLAERVGKFQGAWRLGHNRALQELGCASSESRTAGLKKKAPERTSQGEET
jgi:hypothetical protein